MDRIEVSKLDLLLNRTYPIGFGRTAHVSLSHGLDVVKVYKHNSYGNKLLSDPNFPVKLERISHLSNDTYKGPVDLLYCDGKFVGYTYPYNLAPTLSSVDRDLPVSKLFVNYKKLMADTKKISEQHFKLADPHHRNILFDGSYTIIDLDLGEFEDNQNPEQIYTANMQNVLETILKEIYHINKSHTLMFEDKDINLIYHHMRKDSMDDIEELLRVFADKCEKQDPSIKEVKRKVKAQGVNLGYKKKN